MMCTDNFDYFKQDKRSQINFREPLLFYPLSQIAHKFGFLKFSVYKVNFVNVQMFPMYLLDFIRVISWRSHHIAVFVVLTPLTMSFKCT